MDAEGLVWCLLTIFMTLADTEQVRIVFEAVKDTILQQNLEDLRLA